MSNAFEMGRGESKVFTMTVSSSSGLVDLTDAQAVFKVYDLNGDTVLEKRSLTAGGSDDEIEIPDQHANSDELLGKCYVKISTADSDLEQTARWADCWVVTAADEPETIRVDDHAPFHITGIAPPTFAP